MSEWKCFRCGDGNTPLYCLNCAEDMRKSELAATTGSEDDRLNAAFKKMTDAVDEYFKLIPKRPEPTEPPKITPMLLHANPNSFHRGYNMLLESGGYMPGKIPVIVVPTREQDVKRYKRKRTVRTLLEALGLSSQNNRTHARPNTP